MSVMASIDLEFANGKSIVDFLEKMQQIGFVFYDEEGFAWYSPMCEDPEDDCCEWTQSKISEDELYSIVREKEQQGRTVMVKMDFAAGETAADVPGVTIIAFDRSKVSFLLNKNQKTLEVHTADLEQQTSAGIFCGLWKDCVMSALRLQT